MHQLDRSGAANPVKGRGFDFPALSVPHHVDTPTAPLFVAVDARGGTAQGRAVQQGGGGREMEGGGGEVHVEGKGFPTSAGERQSCGRRCPAKVDCGSVLD